MIFQFIKIAILLIVGKVLMLKNLVIIFTLFTTLTLSADEVEQDDTVTVYGERAEASLFDTSSSVTIYDEQTLESLKGKTSVDQLLQYTPNVTVVGLSTGVAIRGQASEGAQLGGSAFVGGSQPRTTIQIDGRPASFYEFIYGRAGLWDVEQVEVFTGPQTTTQGVNSISGAIFVNTKNPTDTYELKTRIIRAQENTNHVSGVVSGPIVGKEIMGRISFDRRSHNSYRTLTDTTAKQLSLSGGDKPGREKLTNIRGKLLFKPDFNKDFEALLTVNVNRVFTPRREGVQSLPASGISFRNRVNTYPGEAHWDTDSNAYIANLKYRINDAIKFNNISTITKTNNRRYAAKDFKILQEIDELTNEAIFRFNPIGSQFSGLFGVYYRTSQTDDSFNFLRDNNKFSGENNSAAVFGEATYQMLEDVGITLGGRLQNDDIQRRGSIADITVNFDDIETVFLPKAEINYWLNDFTNVGFTATKGYNPGGLGFSFGENRRKPKNFRQKAFRSERLWNYELFFRGSNAQKTLNWQANIFYTDFENAQRQATFQTDSTAKIVLNAEEAMSYGLEAAVKWRYNDQFSTNVAIGYLKTKLEKFSNQLTPGTEGNEFARAPEFTSLLGVTYEPIPLLRFGVTARYNNGYYSDDANTSTLRVPSYTVVDLRADYQVNNFTVFAFANNVLDKFYVTRITERRSQRIADLGDPREIGIGVQLEF